MRSSCICLLIGTLSLSSAAWTQNSTAGAEKSVAALEEQWLRPQKTNNNPDLTTLLLAEGFVDTSSDGKVYSKAGYLALQKSIKWSSAENSDVKVTIFGNTAIATGIEKWKGADASGQPSKRQRALDGHLGEDA